MAYVVLEGVGQGTTIWLLYVFLKRFCLFIYFLKDFIHLLWETQRGRDTGRGRSRLPAGSPMWDSIPGLQDHDLSGRQMLNHWATQAPLFIYLFREHELGELGELGDGQRVREKENLRLPLSIDTPPHPAPDLGLDLMTLRSWPEPKSRVSIFFFFFFNFLFIYDSHRKRERGRLHAPGARRGIPSWVSRIAPWAKGRR